MVSPVHYSSATDDWATPQATYDELNREFSFVLDVCASVENAKCPHFYTKQQDGLSKHWALDAAELGGGAVWVNSPYGRGVTGKWVAKARTESLAGATVVCLLPARTDTSWFHEHVLGHAEVRFLKGRLKFGASKNSAPFPSMVVVFRPRT